MYKLLLCWRYLRTRTIALVCIVSVMLGVATMIVVNSVMAGFTHELELRINGMIGDLMVESRSMDGVFDAEHHMEVIREHVGEYVVGMSPTVQVPALLYIDLNSEGESITRQVTLVGIDEDTYSSVGGFGDYLQHPKNREQLSFSLREDGYDVYDHQDIIDEKSKPRVQMEDAGWRHRRRQAVLRKQREQMFAQRQLATGTIEAEDSSRDDENAVVDPFAATAKDEGRDFDMATDQHTGIILGIGVCSFRRTDGSDYFQALPGDDVRIGFTKASHPPEVLSGRYTVVDFYECKMSEYDSHLVFAPLRELQRSRGMIDPESGVAKFTSIQIKLKPGVDVDMVRDKLANAFPAQLYWVATWKDKQGPLLAAVQMETIVLNVLLFMIIAVAGFGILAIFFMIVVEKTRDIGILKSLGASRWGVMGIFLTYGVALGLVGAGFGTVLGLTIVHYIQEIAEFLSYVMGQPVFDPSIYYFRTIPTIIKPFTVAWVSVGAIVIAVLASVLPALRAANLHPVRALRYE